MPGATFEVRLEALEEVSASRGRSVWSSGSPRSPPAGQTRRKGRVRRGSPRDARVPQRARGPRRRGDARLRRDRRGHRGAGGPRGRPAARPSRRRPSGARRDPPPADRLLRRPSSPGHEGGRRTSDRGSGRRRARRRALPHARRASPAARAPVSHAEELLAEAERVRSRAPATVGRGRPSPDALARLPSNHSRDGRGQAGEGMRWAPSCSASGPPARVDRPGAARGSTGARRTSSLGSNRATSR